MKKYEKIDQHFFFEFFFWIFISIQGVQGATREGPEPISEVKNN